MGSKLSTPSRGAAGVWRATRCVMLMSNTQLELMTIFRSATVTIFKAHFLLRKTSCAITPYCELTHTIYSVTVVVRLCFRFTGEALYQTASSGPQHPTIAPVLVALRLHVNRDARISWANETSRCQYSFGGGLLHVRVFHTSL